MMDDFEILMMIPVFIDDAQIYIRLCTFNANKTSIKTGTILFRLAIIFDCQHHYLGKWVLYMGTTKDSTGETPHFP